MSLAKYLSSYAPSTNGEPAWLTKLRKESAEEFKTQGLPTVRHEEWRYTDLTPIKLATFMPPTAKEGVDGEHFSENSLADASVAEVVFLNGTYSSGLSSVEDLPKGLEIRTFSWLWENDPNRLHAKLGQQVNPKENPFVALNTACFSEGIYIHLSRGTVLDKPIHLLHFTLSHEDTPILYHPRCLIHAENGARGYVIESYVGIGQDRAFSNAVTEVVLEKGAHLHYSKLQDENAKSYHIATLQGYQAGASNLGHFNFSTGASIARNDINTILDDEDAEVTFDGLCMLHGRQHLDNHTRIDHAKPHCRSFEQYKGILDDRSRGVFNGKVIVRKDAQKTDAKQSNNSLLLTDDARIDTKPQLEIWADDVKCTHGATVGQIDEDMLFYLRSRGIHEEAARTMLIYAFAWDVLGKVGTEAVRKRVKRMVRERLPHAELIEGQL